MKLIQTLTLSSTQTLIEFTSIPQDGTDLVALYSLRGANNANEGTVFLRVNGSTSNMSRRDLSGNGSSVASSANADSFVGQIPAVNATSNTFGNQIIYIPNYTSTTAKSYSVDTVEENNATLSNTRIIAGLINVTSAITSLGFSEGNGMIAGSTISLYKITKGSDGIVTTS